MQRLRGAHCVDQDDGREEYALRCEAGSVQGTERRRGEVLSCDLDVEPDEATGIGYISHFVTCPQAERFRKKKNGKENELTEKHVIPD